MRNRGMLVMKIALGCDHGGYDLKLHVMEIGRAHV